MECPACRFENRSGRSYCSQCGAALSIACPGCGFSNEPGEKFCGGCGAALGNPPVTETATPPGRGPTGYATRPTASASGTHFPPWMRRWPRPRLSASIAPERTKGFGTADLKEAKALLDELS